MLKNKKYIDELIIKHEDIKHRYSLVVKNTEEVCTKIEKQYSIISTLEKQVQILEEKIYGDNESLKNKYKKIILRIGISIKILRNLRIRRMRVHGHLRNMIWRGRHCYMLHYKCEKRLF